MQAVRQVVFTDVLIVGRLDVHGQSFAPIGLHKILNNYQENGFSFDFARNTLNVLVPRPEFVKVKVEAYQNT